MNDERIGRYENDRRILPTKTLSGGPVTRPVLNTISLGKGVFAVLDMFPPKHFDVEAEANKLRQSLGNPPIQPRVGETGEPVIDVGTPMFPPSGEIFTAQDDSSTKGRK